MRHSVMTLALWAMCVAAPSFAQVVTIDNLPPASPLTGTETIPVTQGVAPHRTTVKTTTAAIAAEAIAAIPAPVPTGKINGVYLASACGNLPAPGWCRGSDIGAWINAAIADGTGGNISAPAMVIIDPTAGPYTQTTAVTVPLNVTLDGQGAELDSSATSGAQIAVGSGQNSIWMVGPILNIRLHGPGYTAGNTDYGIYAGGDPTGVISPPETLAPGKVGYNVEISGHARGVGWGNHAWSMSFDKFLIHANQEGIYPPLTASSASISSFAVASNVLTLTTGAQSFSAGQTLNIVGTSSSAINGTALTITSATSTSVSAAFSHADVPSTATSGTAFAGGAHNSGELIRFDGSSIDNNLDCGFFGQDVNQDIAISNGSMDYNANAAACGPGAYLSLINVYLEQNNALFFNYGNTNYKAVIHMFGGSLNVAAATGTDTGFAALYRNTSFAYFDGVTVVANHAVTNWVYSNAGVVNGVCVRSPYYISQVGSIAYTDATNAPTCQQN